METAMNRREALIALPGLVVALPATADACHAAAQAIKRPYESPEAHDRYDALMERHFRLSPDVPEDEEPGVHRALVALLDFLDHADEVLTKHEVEEGELCDCQFCYELRGISFAVEGFESLLSGELRHGRLLHFRDKVHRQRQDRNHERRKAQRAIGVGTGRQTVA